MTKVILESSRLRSLTKGLTWELRGLVMIMVIGLAFTGDVSTSFMMTLAYMPLSVTLYFVHERIWKHISWGHIEHVVTSGPTAGKGRRQIRWTGKSSPRALDKQGTSD
jgi:uncharacterized membrane protein